MPLKEGSEHACIYYKKGLWFVLQTKWAGSRPPTSMVLNDRKVHKVRGWRGRHSSGVWCGLVDDATLRLELRRVRACTLHFTYTTSDLKILRVSSLLDIVYAIYQHQTFSSRNIFSLVAAFNKYFVTFGNWIWWYIINMRLIYKNKKNLSLSLLRKIVVTTKD